MQVAMKIYRIDNIFNDVNIIRSIKPVAYFCGVLLRVFVL